MLTLHSKSHQALGLTKSTSWLTAPMFYKVVHFISALDTLMLVVLLDSDALPLVDIALFSVISVI